jgi:hypothetical protein
VFLYIQTVGPRAGRNTFEAGLEKVRRFDVSGPYGYDHTEGQPSGVAKAFMAKGQPWTVVIDKKGTVAYSNWTQLGLRPIINAVDGSLKTD